MPFELSIALKYLVPRKRHLSLSLISWMSVGVISLVVWLLLVFLSVTDGIENKWTKKLTDLHAPIRITPTEAYFSSYYYQADAFSQQAHFSHKTLGEKQDTPVTDPYLIEEDPELPSLFPLPEKDAQGNALDIVKTLTTTLAHLPGEQLFVQDYEMSGATLKLQLLRHKAGKDSLHFLTQVSYLTTPPTSPTILSSLLLPPTLADIEHLFFLTNYQLTDTLSNTAPLISDNTQTFYHRLHTLLSHIQIDSVTLTSIPLSALLQEEDLPIYGLFQNDQLCKIYLTPPPPSSYTCKKGILSQGSGKWEGKSYPLSPETPLLLTSKEQIFQSKISPIPSVTALAKMPIHITGTLSGRSITCTVPWDHMQIHSFSLLPTPPPFASATTPLPPGPQGEEGILLPKSFQDHGVYIGDQGYISYMASGLSSIQEQRIAVWVAGFYDPGILPVGNKCLLVSHHITRTINATNSSFLVDSDPLNGFQVWHEKLDRTPIIAEKIVKALQEAGIDSYFTVTPFTKYDFAKNLLEQFQSDRTLFCLIGILVLIVACCNILSCLLLLVLHKKKEIAILRTMGASSSSIAYIFGLVGTIIGLVGALIGIGAAYFTLHHIDTIAHLLSVLQGHEAFQQAFYGNSLPSTLSMPALLFTLISTPILSLLAGLVPAMRACKLHPCSILRSES